MSVCHLGMGNSELKCERANNSVSNPRDISFGCLHLSQEWEVLLNALCQLIGLSLGISGRLGIHYRLLYNFWKQ